MSKIEARCLKECSYEFQKFDSTFAKMIYYLEASFHVP